MNDSNRYGVESMARQRQAEIEKQLRQAAELRKMQPTKPNRLLSYRTVAVAATALSIVGAIASVVVAHAR